MQKSENHYFIQGQYVVYNPSAHSYKDNKTNEIIGGSYNEKNPYHHLPTYNYTSSHYQDFVYIDSNFTIQPGFHTNPIITAIDCVIWEKMKGLLALSTINEALKLSDKFSESSHKELTELKIKTILTNDGLSLSGLLSTYDKNIVFKVQRLFKIRTNIENKKKNNQDFTENELRELGAKIVNICQEIPQSILSSADRSFTRGLVKFNAFFSGKKAIDVTMEGETKLFLQFLSPKFSKEFYQGSNYSNERLDTFFKGQDLEEVKNVISLVLEGAEKKINEVESSKNPEEVISNKTKQYGSFQ